MNTDKLKDLAMNDNGFVFDPGSGSSYTVNETGLKILKYLSQGLGKSEIRTKILDEYEISEDHFNSDFEHYVLMLESLDLIDF
ncbi:MAG: PqqD family protein [Candidatus Cloacimonadaceae bacterium]|nr:PqqD family protein [Candidatus Cloacimonadaceae bacterium]MDP3114876.1 PqqD family protein [Candidatus Cloacimonadaceae bacterium]